ncbi:MAG TPA: hypothetical protein VGK89_06405 [Candidatus Eisenbacteria bacterium]
MVPPARGGASLSRGTAGASRRPHARAASATALPPWLLPSLSLLLAAIVHRRALGAFFGTDDFVRLEEAAGLLPSAPTLWRLLSEVLYVRLMLGVFGPQPLPFHLVSLALHLVNTALVWRLARRAGLGAGAACLASTLFGVFPLSYSVLLSAVNINDIMALTFVFLALVALEVPTPLRAAAAVASFALALLSKEAVLFVPFAAVLLPQPSERLAGAARRLLPLLVTGVAFAGLYLAFRTHGLGTGGPAYAAGVGPHVFHNLMTYSLWSVDLIRVVPDAQGMFDPLAWRVGLWPLAAFALAGLLSRSRRRTILFGCTWWALALLPVLPLEAHSYAHYLYVPTVGFAVAAAATFEATAAGIARLVSRPRPAPAHRGPSGAPRPGGAREAVVAAALVAIGIAYAARTDALIDRRTTARLGKTQLALDPFTRKMEVARTAIASFRSQLDGDHQRVVVFAPPGLGKPISATTGQELPAVPAGTPSYDVIAGVLGGGVTLRLFEPRLDSVVFVSRWTPEYRDFDLFGEGPAGRLVRMGRGPRGHSEFARFLLGAGLYAQTREYFAEVVATYPSERLLRLLYAVALSGSGAPDSARAQARRVMEGAPPDTISATARRLIAILEQRK